VAGAAFVAAAAAFVTAATVLVSAAAAAFVSSARSVSVPSAVAAIKVKVRKYFFILFI
jgi:hypothetical protein